MNERELPEPEQPKPFCNCGTRTDRQLRAEPKWPKTPPGKVAIVCANPIHRDLRHGVKFYSFKPAGEQ